MAEKNLESYSAADIEILEGLAGVRKRPAMYIGSTNSTGLHHLVWEIVDNAVDEALNGFGNVIVITIHKDGSLSVLDEGRGIPVDIHKTTNMPAVQLIFSTLHSGGKFSSKVYASSAGLHGVGSSVTNALSVYCDITVFRDGKINHLRFENGGKLVTPLEVLGTTRKHGTLVRFKPDDKIFSTTNFQFDVIANHVQESAFLLKGVRFVVLDERTSQRGDFCYNEGLKEYVAYLNKDKTPMDEVISFDGEDSGIKVDIALQYCAKDYGESIYSYANNVRTRDGGTHESGFKMGITKAVNDYATENQLIRGKIKLEGSDIREGLTAIISLKIPEQMLQYEGQTKQKLGTPEAVAIVSNFIYNNMTYYLNEHKEFAVSLVKKCIDAQNARIAARKAKDEARSTRKAKVEMILSDKLTPAQSKDYDKNELFIVEGESAGGTARKGRNRIYQAILPLRGKPLNTDSISKERMLKNEEFATIINTIGAGFGEDFNVDNSHYGKVIIMTDADTDGAHIQTLLITFFYNFMKPLILKGKLFVAMPPLYRVSKEVNHKLVYRYAWDETDLERAKKEIGAGYRVSRFKGLGEMNDEQLWESTMNPASRLLCKVTIEDPVSAAREISILMGNDTVVRRQWVEENVNFNEIDTFVDEVK
ncbi:MAG: DNA topoisomerase IV subunit B [Bacilli bacterium]|nr:type IIA DNA topoisomerase subunit B [Erysipelotrichaceae bacterium]MDY5669859.1 DNA topoisomerase IV subunit B [Bacilli bacterium]